MKIQKLQIGCNQISNNIFLAPMAGYTDYAFRHLAIQMGAGLTFTELVSAKGLVYGGNGSKDLLYSGEDISKTALQLFGSEEYYLRKAIESDACAQFKIIDINMGCPVPKVFKNGEGSALLTDIKKAEKLIKECVKTGKDITVKIRTGINRGDDIATEYAIMAESSGAKAITIHGRVREAYYSGEVDYNAIYKAKRAVKIPVIANGGIFSVEDAKLTFENTGADGIMLARGAIADPFLFCKLLNIENPCALKEFMRRHLTLMSNIYDERKAYTEYRKFIPYYLKGKTGVKELKLKLQTAESVQEILSLIEQNL